MKILSMLFVLFVVFAMCDTMVIAANVMLAATVQLFSVACF